MSGGALEDLLGEIAGEAGRRAAGQKLADFRVFFTSYANRRAVTNGGPGSAPRGRVGGGEEKPSRERRVRGARKVFGGGTAQALRSGVRDPAARLSWPEVLGLAELWRQYAREALEAMCPRAMFEELDRGWRTFKGELPGSSASASASAPADDGVAIMTPPETRCVLPLQACAVLDLHGAPVRIVRSSCPSFVGVSGVVLRETPCAFLVATPDARRVVPKAAVDLELLLWGSGLYVHGASRKGKQVGKVGRSFSLQLRG